MSNNLLSSWKDGPAKRAIVEFVDQVTTRGSRQFVRPEERVAVFDNDGTLWCEKPMPIQVDFMLRRLSEMAANDPALRDRQPWQAACEKDYHWLGAAIVKHYKGDHADLKVIAGGVQQAFGGMSVDDYQARAADFLSKTQHPTLSRPYQTCIYHPMVELLGYLARNGFTNYVVSGGDRDFMRPVTEQLYGIPPERVVGSTFALQYREDEHGNAVLYKPELDVFDDGPEKPVRIWSRIGRRPILAVGNSNGDLQMLRFAGGASLPALRLLILHDDSAREFDYVGGAERVLECAKTLHWTVVSMKNEWTNVFAKVMAAS